ncbi:unnamed protein product [Allacma fusca]|uniref:Uncharacterized protein n=1 Tax=Allacma fusca TaxID=39272 RepID=A0A8J2K584_9HEXA|nr:unnamed protein product [Allacma fusca]
MNSRVRPNWQVDQPEENVGSKLVLKACIITFQTFWLTFTTRESVINSAILFSFNFPQTQITLIEGVQFQGLALPVVIDEQLWDGIETERGPSRVGFDGAFPIHLLKGSHTDFFFWQSRLFGEARATGMNIYIWRSSKRQVGIA